MRPEASWRLAHFDAGLYPGDALARRLAGAVGVLGQDTRAGGAAGNLGSGQQGGRDRRKRHITPGALSVLEPDAASCPLPDPGQGGNHPVGMEFHGRRSAHHVDGVQSRRADDGQGSHVFPEGESPGPVDEQDAPRDRGFRGQFEALGGWRAGDRGRPVEQAMRDHGADHPGDHVVQPVRADASAGEIFGPAPLGVVQPGEVKASPSGRQRIAHREPEVGGDESRPSPLVFQRAEQFRILAGIAAIDLVVRTHDGPGAGVKKSTAKRRKVDLFQGAAGDMDVDRWPAVRWRPAGPGPARLEVIHHEVLDHGHDVPLDAPDVRRSQGSGQARVFPERLGLPPAQRRARDIQRRPEQDIVTCAAGLLTDRGPEPVRQLFVEGRGERHARREGGRVVGHPDAVTPVGEAQWRQPEVGHRGEIATCKRDLVR